mgnify:CR=1 FL=1
MKNDPRFSQEVKIAKETESTWTCANPYAVKNVNVAQGPRTGVQGLNGKRASFIADKEARAPLAKVIEGAYARRQHEYQDFEYTNGGSIHDNTYEQTKKHGVRLGRKSR